MDVFNKFTGHLLRSYDTSDRASMGRVINQARNAFGTAGTLTVNERTSALEKMLDRVERDRDSLSILISEETGKPVSLSLEEIQRTSIVINTAIQTLHRGFGGSLNSTLNQSPGTYAFHRKFSRGTVAGTADCGDPLYRSALKICASIVTGNSMLLFPSRSAPSPSLKLISYLEGTAIPQYTIQAILTEETEVLDFLGTEAEIASGSWKPVFDREEFRSFGMLERFESETGNRNAIIWKDADLDSAAESITGSIFNACGGNYIRSMKVIIHRDVFEYIVNRFMELMSSMKVGDPFNPDTDIGPMIHGSIVSRTSEILRREIETGAFPIMDLNIEGPFIHPVLLDSTGTRGPLSEDGVFGPVISVYKVDSLQEIVDLFSVRPEVGTSSLYTSDINIVKSLFERSRFSSLDVNREPFTSPEHFQLNFMSEVNSDLYTGESVLYL